MLIGRFEKDLKWNYGLSFKPNPRTLRGNDLAVWLFKLTPRFFKVAQQQNGARINAGKKGFMLTLSFNGFKLPKVDLQ